MKLLAVAGMLALMGCSPVVVDRGEAFEGEGGAGGDGGRVTIELPGFEAGGAGGIGGDGGDGGAAEGGDTGGGEGGAMPLDCGPCGADVAGVCQPVPDGEPGGCHVGLGCFEGECVSCAEHGFEGC